MGVCHSRCLGGGTSVTAQSLGLPKTFTIIRELGFGQEGRTYLAKERTSTGTKLFALKAIPRGNLLKADFVLRGLRNQSSLCFEHVVKFLEVILTSNNLIIKFEYVDGGDLFRYVCRQHFITQSQLMEEEHARFLFIQIVFGLYHCHQHRVAHRDIKFANIVCTKGKNPCVKISDFGLSKGWVSPQDAVSFSTTGTLAFMSPEAVRARSTRNEKRPYSLCKSDIWGLGVILYTMLFGAFPFVDPRSVKGNLSKTHVLTTSTSTFSFLLKGMEMAHQTNPSRLTEKIQKSVLSSNAKDILLQMLQMKEQDRIELDALIYHPWIRGGLGIARGRALSAMSEPNMCRGRETPYSHAELVIGSKTDKELQQIIYTAQLVGQSGDPVVRWQPPGVRLRYDMTSTEIAALEVEGIRPCHKCHSDADDPYNNLVSAIPINP